MFGQLNFIQIKHLILVLVEGLLVIPKVILVPIETHIHLGIKVQQDGIWRSHILDIHSKACTGLNIVRMLKHILKRDALTKITLHLFAQF